MSKYLVETTHHQTFESLREEEDGSEFWSARKLSKALESLYWTKISLCRINTSV